MEKHQNFLKRYPDGEMPKHDFLEECEVKYICILEFHEQALGGPQTIKKKSSFPRAKNSKNSKNT